MPDQNKSSNKDGEKFMSFLEHLEELRFRLFRALAAVALCSIVAGIFHKQIFLSLTRTVPNLYWHTPLEPYFTFIKISIVTGIFFSFPIVLFQLWRFVSPGLYEKERKYLLPFIGASWILFVTGAVFVHQIMLPFISSYLYNSGYIRSEQAPRPIEERWQTVAEYVFALDEQQVPEVSAEESIESVTPPVSLESLREQIAQDLQRARDHKGPRTTVHNVWSVGKYVSLALMLFLAFGLAFDLPVVVVLLTLSGIVDVKTLGKARPIVLVLLFVFSAVLTPPDVISQVMMGGPMYLLFEISLICSRVFLKLRRNKREKEEEKDEQEHPEQE
jgi:sec-independent protein translocase protein TatC